MIKDKEKWCKGQLSYRSLMSHEVIRAKDVLGQQPKSTGRTDYFLFWILSCLRNQEQDN